MSLGLVVRASFVTIFVVHPCVSCLLLPNFGFTRFLVAWILCEPSSHCDVGLGCFVLTSANGVYHPNEFLNSRRGARVYWRAIEPLSHIIMSSVTRQIPKSNPISAPNQYHLEEAMTRLTTLIPLWDGTYPLTGHPIACFGPTLV